MMSLAQTNSWDNLCRLFQEWHWVARIQLSGRKVNCFALRPDPVSREPPACSQCRHFGLSVDCKCRNRRTRRRMVYCFGWRNFPDTVCYFSTRQCRSVGRNCTDIPAHRRTCFRCRRTNKSVVDIAACRYTLQVDTLTDGNHNPFDRIHRTPVACYFRKNRTVSVAHNHIHCLGLSNCRNLSIL